MASTIAILRHLLSPQCSTVHEWTQSQIQMLPDNWETGERAVSPHRHDAEHHKQHESSLDHRHEGIRQPCAARSRVRSNYTLHWLQEKSVLFGKSRKTIYGTVKTLKILQIVSPIFEIIRMPYSYRIRK